jgi:hypothetical protein
LPFLELFYRRGLPATGVIYNQRKGIAMPPRKKSENEEDRPKARRGRPPKVKPAKGKPGTAKSAKSKGGSDKSPQAKKRRSRVASRDDAGDI